MCSHGRARQGDDPACRRRRVLRVGRAAGRSPPARAAGDRRRRGRARGQLRGEGVRRPDGDGRGAGPAAVPAGDRGLAAHVGLRRGEQGDVPRCSTTRPRSSRGSRSTRRSSTCAGWSGSPARPPRSPRGCGATSSSGSACRSRSASPGRSSSPRWRAAWPSPTACSSCRPTATASSPSSTRSRWSGSGASGPSTADKLHRRGIATVGEVARLSELALVSMLGRASGRHLHALAHNRDPRPVQVRPPPPLDRRPARARAGRRARPPRSTPTLVALVDRVTRRMRAAGRVGRTVVLRLRFDDFSRATRSHTLPRATAQTQTILAAARALLATATPMIERRGHHARRHRGRQPRRRRRDPAHAADRPLHRRRARRRPRRGAGPVRLRGDHAGRAARPRPGPDDAAAPRLSSPGLRWILDARGGDSRRRRCPAGLAVRAGRAGRDRRVRARQREQPARAHATRRSPTR